MKGAALVCFLAYVAAVASVEGLTVAKVSPPEIPVDVIDIPLPKILPIEPIPDEKKIEAAAASAQKTISESINEALTLARCPFSVCTLEYNPVCGFSLCNGVRTFSNPCMFKSYNRCNYPGYKFLFQGDCELLVKCNSRTFYDVATAAKENVSPAA